jgi:hypothetical protein
MYFNSSVLWKTDIRRMKMVELQVFNFQWALLEFIT